MRHKKAEKTKEVTFTGHVLVAKDGKNQSITHRFSPEPEEVMIDWNQITSRGLDEKTITEVMPTYMEEKKKRLQRLISAVKDSDVEGVRMHAHAIKGAARNLGITKLSEIAGSLENMAKEEKLLGAEELLQEIKKEFGKIESFVSKPNWTEIAKEQAARKMPAGSTAPS
jgi:HPt (histidine-containing phosphotransfer) domain-containing protein